MPTRKRFWNKAFLTRCMGSLRVPGAAFLGTTNPDSPNNFVKTDFLDRKEKLGLSHWHFTMDDNPSLSEEYKEQVAKEYTGVFYDRFIRGLWVRAEGVIYRQFADSPEMFIVGNCNEPLITVVIGIDYGASRSKTTMKAVGIAQSGTVYALDESDLSGVYDPDRIYREFEDFYLRVVAQYHKCLYVYADYGALGQVLTSGLQKYCQRNGLPVAVRDCVKGRIFERIELTTHLMALGRLKICSVCKNLISAFSDAVWDDKKEDERLDDGNTDIDSLDAFEYAVLPQRNLLLI